MDFQVLVALVGHASCEAARRLLRKIPSDAKLALSSIYAVLARLVTFGLATNDTRLYPERSWAEYTMKVALESDIARFIVRYVPP